MTKKQIPAKASKKALAKDKNGTLEETVVTLLKKKKLQLSLAECLGVKKSTLKEQGAVSAKCAKQMAKGACKASGADISVSVTGLAGPGDGTEETPVGTVFMGCCYQGKTIAKEFHFTGDRLQIREQTAEHALMLLRDCMVKGIPSK